MKRYVEDAGLPFHILVDESREVTKRYGVWHRMGLDAWNISRPALFVVDSSGVIRAIFVGESQEEFPGADEIETALAEAITNTKVTKHDTKTTKF